MLNEKNDAKFSPNVRIRKIWISKQYLVYKDELTVKGKVSITREKENNGRYSYHSKQEIKKEKPSKEKNVFPKERHTFPERKGRNASRRKIPPSLLSLLLFHENKNGMWCNIRNSLKSSLELTKRMM